MKKDAQLHKWLLLAAGLLAVGFLIQVGVDYYRYQDSLNSAPFRVFVLARALEYLLPGLLCLLAGLFLRKRAVPAAAENVAESGSGRRKG